MKNNGVCDGCIYWKRMRDTPMLGMFCDFIEMEGQSRIIVEQENGGIKKIAAFAKIQNLWIRKRRVGNGGNGKR